MEDRLEPRWLRCWGELRPDHFFPISNTILYFHSYPCQSQPTYTDFCRVVCIQRNRAAAFSNVRFSGTDMLVYPSSELCDVGKRLSIPSGFRRSIKVSETDVIPSRSARFLLACHVKSFPGGTGLLNGNRWAATESRLRNARGV